MASADRRRHIPFGGDDGRYSRSAGDRSLVVVAIVKAKKASASKKMKAAPKLQNSPHGPAIPSSEKFAYRQAEESSSTLDVTSPSGITLMPEFAPAALPSNLSFEGSAAATGEQGTAVAVADAAPSGGKSVSSPAPAPMATTALSPRKKKTTVETPPLKVKKPHITTLRTSSRAAVRLALQRICRGSSLVDNASDPTHPVAVSSESSSEADDDIFPNDSHDVSSLEVESHSTGSLAAEGGANETGTVDSHGPDGVQTPSPSQLLQQSTYPITCTVEATVEQMTLPPASTPAVDLVTLPTASHTDSVLVATGVLPSSEETAADLWCEVDDQVSFDIPVAASLLGTFPLDVPVKQNLSHLQSMVARYPTLTYSALKAVAEKMTELLILMGSPLEDWFRRVTLLLKLVKRREFLANELPGRLAVLKTQRSECELALRPLQGERDRLHIVFNSSQTKFAAVESTVAQLKLELAAWEAVLQELATSQAQQAEAISSAEKKVVSATLELKELQVRKESLEAMLAFPFAGILPLEEIFKDL